MSLIRKIELFESSAGSLDEVVNEVASQHRRTAREVFEVGQINLGQLSEFTKCDI